MKSTSERVIVVGAGIGGLAAALSLSSKGIPVTLIEKHGHAGGKIRQAQIAGKWIDTGPTVFTMRWVFDKLFSDAGLSFEEHVSFAENSLLARHSWEGSNTLDLHSNVDLSVQAIEAFAGTRDAKAYRVFVAKSEAIFNTLNAPFMQAERPSPLSLTFANGIGGLKSMADTKPFTSLWKYLSKTFNDPRLIQLFGRYATYCGSSPMQAPATLMLIAHAERAGVWVIDGGMRAVADAMLQAATSKGCECLFGQSVKQILTNSSGVQGVQLDSGEKLPSKAVIFNGDTQALAVGMLGSSCSTATQRAETNSLSAITRCEVAQSHGFKLAHHNVFFGENYSAEFDAIFNQQQICKDPTFYVCAQDRTENATSGSNLITGPERLFSLMNAPARELRADEIQSACQLMTERLSAHGLQLKQCQGKAHIETPNSFAKLFPASQGALYGRPTHGWMGSFNRPGSTTSINGLYLAGGSVHPGAGVPMVAMSGQLAARRLLADR